MLRMPARLAVGCAWNAVALLAQETWNVMGCVGGALEDVVEVLEDFYDVLANV